MNEKNKRKQIAKISVFITSIFVIFLSVTYAFINMTLTGTKRQVITAGNLELVLDEDENNLQIVDALPMYDEVGMLQDAFTFRLINRTSQNADYVLKLEDITVGEPLSKDDVKYGLTKSYEVVIDLVSTIEDGVVDQGTIQGNETIEYSLRLWIKDSVTEVSTIQNKSIRYKINIEATLNTSIAEEETGIGEVSELAFAEEILEENCKTYNDGVDTFLVGQCSQNYVWYSGKLWRVVLKNNETGAVKMVTDNAITTIPYNASGNSAFENSYVDQWLSQEFLPTLHDYEKYLETDSVWDASIDSSNAPTRPAGTTTVNRIVGLLNAYEFYTTYNNSDGLATISTGYLNNNMIWFLITPSSASLVRKIDVSNDAVRLSNQSSGVGIGVRPSVILKSDIQISIGSGSNDDPYRLVADEQQLENGITQLNTRYSGEYITFNDELYRIVGVENTLTKIIAVNNTLISIPFNSSKSISDFSQASIKTTLENYYQNDIKDKSLIEPNTVWYLGLIKTGSNYKESICAEVDTKISSYECEKITTNTMANVGLPRIGEMFVS